MSVTSAVHRDDFKIFIICSPFLTIDLYIGIVYPIFSIFREIMSKRYASGDNSI